MPLDAEHPYQSELVTESQTGLAQIKYFYTCRYL